MIGPGYPWRHEIDLMCGGERLGEIDSCLWIASGANPGQPACCCPPGGLGAVTVEVTLNEDEFVAYTPGESDG